MGNCIKKGSSTQFAGDIWSSDDDSNDSFTESKDHLLGYSKGDVSSTEVKIKISKKQLQEFLNKADFQGMSAHQVLARLMDVSDGFEAHHRSWRPALQSIPE